MQKRLLISLSRSDKLPMAFYNPNHKPSLLRNYSGKSSLTARSNKSDKSLNNTMRSPGAFRSSIFRTPKLARKRTLSAREDEGKRSARLAADKNFGKQKFVSKLPDKALRSTFQIVQNDLENKHDAIIKSLHRAAANLASKNVDTRRIFSKQLTSDGAKIVQHNAQSRQMSLTNADGFKYATQIMPSGGVDDENEEIIAFSQPAKSNLGQKSDFPDVINPLHQRIVDHNNLVRADTAIIGMRKDKILESELVSKDQEY